MKTTNLKPDDFISSIAGERQHSLKKLDGEISRIMVGQPREMWEGKLWGGTEQRIIGYGRMSYQRSDKKTADWFVIGLALQKEYISIYVNAVKGNQYLAELYKKTLGNVKVGKSNISFKSLSDLNLDVLLELVTEAKKLNPRT